MRGWILGLGALCGAAPGAAAAQDYVSGDQLRGFLDVRFAASQGERSWTDDALGKTRFDGADDGLAGHPFAAGMLVWRPHLTWSLDGFVTLQADAQATPAVDIVEAFVSYRGAPRAGWRWSGRAGLFYPPVSLEHDGLGWTPTQTITPSALNSWISEEVKVVGVEATARRAFGEQEVAVTGALFGYNDTSGTLLAFRGWALGDVMAGANQKLPLPPFVRQADTMASAELDGRIGYYARLEVRPIGPLRLQALHYDNAGDRDSDKRGLTDWETHFTEVGARLALGPDTRLLAQAAAGGTVWGRMTQRGFWSDQDFSTAYLLLAHDLEDRTLSGRLDYFDLTDRSDADLADNGETGWAATAAYIVPLSDSLRLAFEALRVSSDCPERERLGLDPQQEQTTLQTSLKASF